MKRIYRPQKLLRIVYLLIFLFNLAICSGLMIFVYRPTRQNQIPAVVVGLFLAYLLFSYFHVSQIRLEVSDSGINYFSGSYIISTSWENVERMGKRVLGLGRWPVEGLILRHPSAAKTSWIAKVFSSNFLGFFSSDAMAYEVDYSRSIPLQGAWYWDWNWRKTKLAEDIRHYRPDLFGEHG